MTRHSFAARLLGVVALSALMVGSANAQLFGGNKDDTARNSARLGQLEDQIRMLTGQVEEMSFQVRNLEEALRRAQEDNEYRLQQLEGTGGGAPRPAAQAAPAVAPQTTLAAPATNQAAVPTGSTLRQEQVRNVQNTPAQPSGGPLDLSALANQQAVVAAPAAQGQQGGGILVAPGDVSGFNGNIQASLTGDPNADYNMIYEVLESGNFGAAEEGFDTFMGMYPDHELSGDAQFWYGESLFEQNKHREAAAAFLKAYNNYPQNSLAADSLFKLAMSLKGLGETDAACATFSELKNKFPTASPDLLQEAQLEQQRSKCN
ncbi:tol-pal system protein YbgF [Rhodobacteraceae bacterium RKSG542]|uniref:tol-pal system protein YbgF n=1 Tax=Pseudovibrio flavus TaxID=2529854 RepID=UPI0012BCCCED|nr:tol-pal system protein YbgF [Pseudovibrio flavus]MTI16604.1 tol-pal system protein YbgF [Pseudovibrio flavus]